METAMVFLLYRDTAITRQPSRHADSQLLRYQLRDKRLTLVGYHRPDRFALVHEVEALVNLIERQYVSNQVIYIDLTRHVPINDLWHIGSPACATKGRTLPYPAGYQLERTGLNLLAGARNPDDHRYPPATMAALECLAHDIDVADAFETVVCAAPGQIDKVRDQILLQFLRVDEVGQPELAPERLACRVEIHAHDHPGACHARALNHVEPDAAQPEHHDAGAWLDP